MTNRPGKPLVAVVGETASGKSSLGIEVAKMFDGEIIAADSRTVYREMDIGTAKPNDTERSLVPHHLLDIVDPDQRFSAAEFQKLAYTAINDIESRGKLPILVGGTGLYIDSVLFDYQFESKGDEPDVDRQKMRENSFVVGLRLSKSQLRERIESRVENMFKVGLRKEVDWLVNKYGWDIEALTGIGYREFRPYYEEQTSMSKVKRDIVQDTLQFAKRQRTWFKRNSNIKWFENPREAIDCVADFLSRRK